MVPALGSFVWFAIFGTIGINLGPEIASEAIQVTETAFFVVMKHMPYGNLISIIAVLLLCTFFVTSADSATFVLGMLSSNGDLNPSTQKKIIWGTIQSLMAFSLMMAGGLSVTSDSFYSGSFSICNCNGICMLLSTKSFKRRLGER